MKTTRTLVVGALSTWFLAACAAGMMGVLNESGRPPLVLLAFLVVPIAVFLTAYFASSSLRAFAHTIDMRLLVGSHVTRFVGIGFVAAVLSGELPAGFGLPAGIGDTLAAAGALALLLTFPRTSRGWLLAWNAFGLIDLALAPTLGVLYSNSVIGLLGRGAVTTKLMVTFPVSLIPSFFVPLLILAHLLTFRRLAESTPELPALRPHAHA
jgi:hypothetical protein